MSDELNRESIFDEQANLGMGFGWSDGAYKLNVNQKEIMLTSGMDQLCRINEKLEYCEKMSQETKLTSNQPNCVSHYSDLYDPFVHVPYNQKYQKVSKMLHLIILNADCHLKEISYSKQKLPPTFAT